MSNIIKSRFADMENRQKKSISVIEVRGPEIPQEEAVIDHRLIVAKAQKEADSLLAEAAAQRKALFDQIEKEKAEWESEKAALREAAFQEGYGEGLEIGSQEGFKQYKELLEQAKNVIELSKASCLEKLESSEAVIAELGVKLAGKVISQQLAKDSDAFLSIAKQLVKEVKEYEEIKLFVHPEQFELLLQQKDELQLLLASESELYIYPDEDLEKNGCYAETSFGRIEASIDVQLEQLKNQLLELLGGEEQR
ncbi:flagellar assembly protein FliH [Metabacillus sp. GX 13764]|uniref:flagellar assembly protein FliH n=1 Tax=Metabacillus kandeliae TaxID=2900151 RepID=UPI001E500B41|nr:flagellar assembly protein FliH [Metabacillus kandeliae]MCD7033782.1 flagellar assembly protein FliH [Metabacillus kandeliae]